MSQFFVDPSSFDASDWTQRTGSSAAPLALEVDPLTLLTAIVHKETTFSDATFSYDPAGTAIDVEIVTRSRSTSTASQNKLGMAARIQSTSFYMGMVFSASTLYLGKSVNNSRTYYGNVNGVDVTVYSFKRYRVSGSSLKLKQWLGTAEDEPAGWDLESTDTSIAGSGYAGLYRRATGEDYYQFIGIGTNGDPAPTGPVSGGETGLLASEATSSDTWAVTCQSAATLSAAAITFDTFSAIAKVNTSMISAAQATDNTDDQPDALGTLSESTTGNDTLDALANAAAALSAGAAAGEAWTVQAQVVVNLLEEGVAFDQIRRQTDDAINAALAEQSAASDQFVASINAMAGLTDTATASDAYLAVIAQLGSIASGAIASDSFRTSFGLLRTLQSSAAASDTFSMNFGFQSALQSGALSSDAWLLMVTMSAALSEACTANDLLQAKARVTTRVTAVAIGTSRFAIVNAGIQYLVMGSIILRDALNYRVTHKPALNQSVKIKPGH